MREGVNHPQSEFHRDNGRTCRRNQMKADGNSFPESRLRWMIGGSARVPRAGSGVAPEPLVKPFSLGDEGFRRDAENSNRDGRAPHY